MCAPMRAKTQLRPYAIFVEFRLCAYEFDR